MMVNLDILKEKLHILIDSIRPQLDGGTGQPEDHLRNHLVMADLHREIDRLWEEHTVVI